MRKEIEAKFLYYYWQYETICQDCLAKEVTMEQIQQKLPSITRTSSPTAIKHWSQVSLWHDTHLGIIILNIEINLNLQEFSQDTYRVTCSLLPFTSMVASFFRGSTPSWTSYTCTTGSLANWPGGSRSNQNYNMVLLTLLLGSRQYLGSVVGGENNWQQWVLFSGNCWDENGDTPMSPWTRGEYWLSSWM